MSTIFEMDTPDPASHHIIKRSLSIAGHSTSISLEQAFWDELKSIAASKNQPVASLVRQIDATRGTANLSSALRVYILQTTRGSGQSVIRSNGIV